MTQRYDVAVIGAGPVGSYTAWKLAESGIGVVAFESHRTPDDNVVCTGIISNDCWKKYIQPLGIPSRPLDSATLFSPTGMSLRISQPGPQAYIIDRPSLNRVLSEKAASSGAAYRYEARVSGVITSPDRCLVQFSQNGTNYEITSDIVVAACGLNSPIPRQQGLAPFSHRVIGAQTEVKASIGDIEVYLDNELAPGGFAWLAPTSGESALAGLVSRPNAIRHLRTFLERLQRDGRIASISSVGQKAIPVGMRRRTVNGRFAIVGEAAGQTKATTFGGIYTGLLCADLLVDTILAASAGNSPPEPVLKTYDRTWRQKIGGELARGYRLRRFYDSLDNRSIDRIFKIVESNGLIQRVLKRSDYSFDWHSGLLTRVLSNPGQVPSLLFHGPVWSPRMLWEFARMVLGR